MIELGLQDIRQELRTINSSLYSLHSTLATLNSARKILVGVNVILDDSNVYVFHKKLEHKDLRSYDGCYLYTEVNLTIDSVNSRYEMTRYESNKVYYIRTHTGVNRHYPNEENYFKIKESYALGELKFDNKGKVHYHVPTASPAMIRRKDLELNRTLLKTYKELVIND